MLKTTESYMQGYRVGKMDGKVEQQQAYDRAMAHNAMLREALTKMCGRFSHDEKYRLDALNATEADADAWEKKLRQEVMLAVHPLQPEYEKLKALLADEIASNKSNVECCIAQADDLRDLQKQLATVTNERDALREYCNRKIANPFGSYDDFTRGEVACAESILDLLDNHPAISPI